VVAESLPRDRHRAGQPAVPEELAALRARGVAVVPHGISLSLGSAEPAAGHRIEHLAACAAAVAAPLVSEHIAFVRAGGLEAGHLLPVPRTREALDALTGNIARARAALEVPLALENIAALFDWPDDEYSEAEFLAELVDRTGVLLLLDLANVYANARNRGRDPLTELLRLPAEHVAYCHVAGGHESGGRYHDTHTDPLPAEILALVAEFTTRHPAPMMLENWTPSPQPPPGRRSQPVPERNRRDFPAGAPDSRRAASGAGAGTGGGGGGTRGIRCGRRRCGGGRLALQARR
jgi:uncharacterized protein (UPF0276 family)